MSWPEAFYYAAMFVSFFGFMSFIAWLSLQATRPQAPKPTPARPDPSVSEVEA